MPSIGWVTKEGLQYPFEDAMKIAREEGAFEKFPPAMLAAMQDTRDDAHWLSPSSATRCNRQRVLKLENDYYQDLEGSWPAFTGNAYHREMAEGIRQKFGIHSHMLEERWKKFYLEVTLRDGTKVPFSLEGTPDLYDIDYNTLYDWKSIGDFVYYDPKLKQKVNRVFPYPEHEIQINLYALMFQEVGIKRAFIWYVKSEGKKGVTRRLVPVELWEPAETYDMACQLAEPLAWHLKTGELPQERYDEENFICRLCPLKELCQSLAAEGK